jgi:hypothetical protein
MLQYVRTGLALSASVLVCGALAPPLLGQLSPAGGSSLGPPKILLPDSQLLIFPVEKITSPAGGESDRFGASVALIGDTVFVGSPGDDTAGEDVGAVYMFDWDGLAWNPQGVLVPQTPEAGQAFGAALAADPNQPDVLFVGSDDGNAANPATGSVYVFERDAQGGWIETDRLTGNDVGEGAGFGLQIYVHGATLVIGAPFEDNSIGALVGNAYVFERDSTGSWLETAKLFPRNVPSAAIFGSAVATDGDRVLVGAPYLGFQFLPGSAFVFSRTPNGWAEEAMLRRPSSAGRDRFGRSAMLINGRAYVGAPADGLPPIGTVSTFERTESGGSVTWNAIDSSPAYDTEPFDRYGNRMAYGGGRLAVAAPNRSTDPSIYLFDVATGTPEFLTKIVQFDGSQNTAYGDSVALSRTAVAVGAPFDSDVSSLAGAVYMYEIITGDVDGDGAVTPRDLRIIVRALGACEGDADYEQAADLDRNGCINIDDLLIFLGLWH